ncbi:hypothetical protein SJ709_15080, partial [Enterococcus faecium]
CEIMLETGFTGDPSGIKLLHSYLPGGITTLQTDTVPKNELNKWQKLIGTRTVTYGSSLPNEWYPVFKDIRNLKPSGKVRVRNIKIEEGSTATPYQPNLLVEPYNMCREYPNENIADPKVKFPIESGDYPIYQGYTEEELMIGQTYTITLKGTKPASQTFVAYNHWTARLGELKPVDGLTDVWSLTFTPTNVVAMPKLFRVYQYPQSTVGACQIDWLKIEKGDTRTPNISQFKYFGEGLKDSNNPNDYSWDVTPEYTEKGLNNAVNVYDPQRVEGLKNFADGIQIAGDKVISENDCTVYTLTKDNSQSFIDGYATFIKHGKEVVVNGTVKFKKAYAFGVPLDDEVPDEFIARIVHGMLTGQSGTNSVSKAMYVQKDLGKIMTNSEFAANEWFTFHGNYWVGVK